MHNILTTLQGRITTCHSEVRWSPVLKWSHQWAQFVYLSRKCQAAPVRKQDNCPSKKKETKCSDPAVFGSSFLFSPHKWKLSERASECVYMRVYAGMCVHMYARVKSSAHNTLRSLAHLYHRFSSGSEFCCIWHALLSVCTHFITHLLIYMQFSREHWRVTTHRSKKLIMYSCRVHAGTHTILYLNSYTLFTIRHSDKHAHYVWIPNFIILRLVLLDKFKENSFTEFRMMTKQIKLWYSHIITAF